MPLIVVPPLQVFDSTGGARLAPGTRVRIGLAEHAAGLGIEDTTAVDRVRLRAELWDHDGWRPSIGAMGATGAEPLFGADDGDEVGLFVEAELDGDDVFALRIAGDGPTHLRLTVVGYREWDQSDYVDESEVPPGTLPQSEPTEAEIDPGEAAGVWIADTEGPGGTAPRVLRGDGDTEDGANVVHVEVLADDDPEALAAMADWEQAADDARRRSS